MPGLQLHLYYYYYYTTYNLQDVIHHSIRGFAPGILKFKIVQYVVSGGAASPMTRLNFTWRHVSSSRDVACNKLAAELTKTAEAGRLSDDDAPRISQDNLVDHLLRTEVVLGDGLGVSTYQDLAGVGIRAHAAHLRHVGRGEGVLRQSLKLHGN